MLAYPIELMPEDNGTLLVTCPDLPEVTTFGDDERDALVQAGDAIEVALASRIAAGEPVPLPSPAGGRLVVRMTGLTAVKVEFYRTLTASGVGIAELAGRLAVAPSAAAKLAHLDSPTPLPQLEAAFSALGKQLEIIVRDAA